ncbi:YqiJ family protein [Usitatibacter palustris]|uniref:Inner membrane protein YqiJ n=1 Tax=Usitatibacter palustris TaxID=2732487 RepID=A0A6M4H8A2_9PROT|nr:YqiJ family protein [Usitatibacter palustris]QJR14614.1 Inner membrane protein YqiJ [Usitatibacter palustris]
MGVFLAPESAPFLIATLVMLVIAAVEGVALLVGMSASHWLDSLVSHEGHEGGDVPADSWLGWLHVGRVPLLVLVVIFLATYAVIGFLANIVVHALFGIYIPALIGAPAAFVATLPVVRISGGMLARVLPREQSAAVSLDSLVGRIATVTGGTAKHGYPAQARLTTEFGQTLYVLVEPDQPETTFGANDQVLLVKRVSGKKFECIRNPKPDLL